MSFWDNFIKQIEKEFKANPDSFLRQANIKKAIAYHDRKYTEALLDRLKDSQHISYIKDPSTGDPNTLNGYSMSTLRSLAYITEMEKHFDLSSVDHVFDFGAGYGNFCRVFNKIYSPKFYTSIDLPAMQEIQKHYLQNYDIDLEYTQHDQNIQPKGKSLFIATFSLCECDGNVRAEVNQWIDKFDYIFIAHRDNFNDTSNTDYFNQLKTILKNYNIEHIFDKESAKMWLICKKEN